jgi:hypothetical protein
MSALSISSISSTGACSASNASHSLPLMMYSPTSWLRASPSWASRSRETASYSYRPCCALVVDLIGQTISSRPSARAISSASMVLPVPGSPLTSSGRCRVMAAFTAIIRSAVAT